MRVSVITPTIRKDGLDVIRKCLERQTWKNTEWLIGSPFDPGMGTWVKDEYTRGYWTLNRILTALCKRASGEFLVFWQDGIWIPNDGISRFVDNWIPGRAISGVGDQYQRLNPYGKPEVKIWSDPRKNIKYGSFYECNPEDWELNWACVSKKDMADAGYFPDAADFEGYGADNVMMAHRLERNGVRFFLDQANESYTLRHGRERKDWDEHYIMHTPYFQLKKYL